MEISLSRNTKEVKAEEVLRRLQKAYPDARCSLNYTKNYELLIATILSAQCTDKRVNQTTDSLFKKYTTIESFAYCNKDELANDIHSCGYHNQKSKSIQGACLWIVEEFDRILPDSLEELIKLPGVGRKTANCVLGECFAVPSLVVDTHMIRIMILLGFTKSSDPVKIEREMMGIIPEENWIKLTHMVIEHGRKICIARRPLCHACMLVDLCPSAHNT
jgi:endonuclease-3